MQQPMRFAYTLVPLKKDHGQLRSPWPDFSMSDSNNPTPEHPGRTRLFLTRRNREDTIAVNTRSVRLLILLVTSMLAACAIQPASPASSPSPTCSPRPCATVDGVIVTFSGLNPNAPPGRHVLPEGYHLVRMQITMLNGSSETRTVSPSHFELHDAAGFMRGANFPDAAGCDSWQAADVAPGASFGPKPLCFEAAGDPGRLSLDWSPGGSAAQRVHVVLLGGF